MGSALGWQPYRHLWANCLENVEASTSHSSKGLHGLLQEYFYLFFYFLLVQNTFYMLFDAKQDKKNWKHLISNFESITSPCYCLSYWASVTMRAIYTISVSKQKVLELILQKRRPTEQKEIHILFIFHLRVLSIYAIFVAIPIPSSATSHQRTVAFICIKCHISVLFSMNMFGLILSFFYI
jgi:hypothetical protein